MHTKFLKDFRSTLNLISKTN